MPPILVQRAAMHPILLQIVQHSVTIGCVPLKIEKKGNQYWHCIETAFNINTEQNN